MNAYRTFFLPPYELIYSYEIPQKPVWNGYVNGNNTLKILGINVEIWKILNTLIQTKFPYFFPYQTFFSRYVKLCSLDFLHVIKFHQHWQQFKKTDWLSHSLAVSLLVIPVQTPTNALLMDDKHQQD